MDESLQSYARAYLLRAKPETDQRSVEAYVTDGDFRALVAHLNKNLLKEFERFLSSGSHTAQEMVPPPAPPAAPVPQTPQAPASITDALRPFPLTNLSTGAQLAPNRIPGFQAYAEMGADTARLPSMAQHPAYGQGAAPAESLPPSPPASPPLPNDQPAQPVQAALPQSERPDAVFQVPNARVGVEYVHRIEPVDASEAVVFLDLAVADGLTLAADTRTGTLSGTPLSPGEYSVIVTYHFERQSPSRQRRATINLSVMPDPRSMWKNLRSDPSAPYPKAEEECSALDGSDMSIVAASKRGRSHAHVGSFRDDDYRIQHVADGDWYIAVVADGAGSARFSRRGAAIICEEAKNQIQRALSDHLVAGQIDAQAHAYAEARTAAQAPEQVAALQQTLRTSLSRVVGNAAYYAATAIFEELAQRADLGGVFKDYSSTALIAICKRYPFGTLCAAYWVGDGAIGVYSERDGIVLLGDVDSGEYSGQTRFLDSTAIEHEALLRRTRFEIVDDMTALVLMTDGVSDAKFETESRLSRPADWDQFWNELKSAVGFSDREPGKEGKLLDWLDFWSQGNHDDRTIAIIY